LLNKKKVLIGLSGGVDSSVAAALLIGSNYDVTGIMLKMYNNIHFDNDEYDAKKVAQILDIPFYTLDCEKLFKEKVIEDFRREYNKGRTPNPCVNCNRYVKFQKLLEEAISQGCDYIATGHYSRIEYNKDTKRYMLKRAASLNNDQSYFLYKLTQDELSKTIFPLGNYSKEEVRKTAEKYRLHIKEKRDSQEICFLNNKSNYIEFLRNCSNNEIMPGYFVDKNGNILGEHKGIIHYTIGQKKRLGLENLGKSMCVVKIDVENNLVILGNENDVFSETLVANDLNLISIPEINEEIRIKAKIRYKAKNAPALLYPIGNGEVGVNFDLPQRAITPGQSVVFYDFYDEDIVLGGGVIISSS